MSAAAAVIYAPVLAVSLIASPPHLTARSWVFLAGTAVLQTGYFVFLLRAYRAGDLSAVYPIGRGSGALLAALGGIAILGERPGPAGLAGIVLLVTGVIIVGVPARTSRGDGASVRARRGPRRACRPRRRARAPAARRSAPRGAARAGP